MWIAKAICKALQQLKRELAVNFALFVVQPVSVVKFKVGKIIYAVEKQKREKSIRIFGMASSLERQG